MSKKNKVISGLIYGYLALPVFVFVLGWLRWYWAVLFGIAILAGWYQCIRNDTIDYEVINLRENRAKLFSAFIVICFWVYLSGIGGMCYQNYDHQCRTGIFRTLVEYSWPVVSEDGTRGLIYYFGFWLLPAVIGKITRFGVGYLFQAVWAVFGIFLTYFLLCVWRKKVSVWPLAIMIGFSGLDFVGYWLLQGFGRHFPYGSHLEWWADDYQFSSMTTQLFYVFNQAIPAWLATMAIFLNKENKKNILYILGSIMITSTFPFVGLIPIAGLILLKGFRFAKDEIRKVFSLQNVVGTVIMGGVTFLLLISNTAVNPVADVGSQPEAAVAEVQEQQSDHAGAVDIDSETIQEAAAADETYREEIVDTSPKDLFMWLSAAMKFFMFLFLEFGAYALIIQYCGERSGIFYLTAVLLCIYPLILVGGYKDFGMRASIPPLFIILLLVIKTIDEQYKKNNRLAVRALIVILLIGGVTPFNEFHSSIYRTWDLSEHGESVRAVEISTDAVMNNINFSGNVGNSILYRFFAKQRVR